MRKGERGEEAPTARWEFRCWPPAALAHDIAALLDAAGDWQDLPHERRTDTYLLPPNRPDLLPKLRGGKRFEIKRRLEVRDALERWTMPLSEPLPLHPAAGERATKLLGEARPIGELDPAALAHLGWIVARVDKARRRWNCDGTTVEVTETSLGWTVAAEEPDRRTLLSLIRLLHLCDLANDHYGTRLQSSTLSERRNG